MNDKIIVRCEDYTPFEQKKELIGIGIEVILHTGIEPGATIKEISTQMKYDPIYAGPRAVYEGLQIAKEIFQEWESHVPKHRPKSRFFYIELGDHKNDIKSKPKPSPIKPPYLEDITSVEILTTSYYAARIFEKGKCDTQHEKTWLLAVQGHIDFFKQKDIPVKIRLVPKDENDHAHDLAMSGMLGVEHKYKTNLKKLVDEGMRVVPLIVFRKKEWECLTISEALIVELVDNAKLSLPEVAKELGRAYNTVRNQYINAKKKLTRLDPTQKQ